MIVLNNKQTYELGQIYEKKFSNEIKENRFRPFQGFYTVKVSRNLYVMDYYGVPGFYAVKMKEIISYVKNHEQKGIAVNGVYFTDINELDIALNPAE